MTDELRPTVMWVDTLGNLWESDGVRLVVIAPAPTPTSEAYALSLGDEPK